MSDTEYDSDYGENKVISTEDDDAEIEQAVENTIKEVEAQPIDEPEQGPAKKLTKKEKKEKNEKSENNDYDPTILVSEDIISWSSLFIPFFALFCVNSS